MGMTVPRPFTDDFVEVIDLKSELNGSDYQLRIGLPRSYHSGAERYPVLVVLDAEFAFGTAYEAMILEALWSRVPRSKEAIAPVPECVVVGVAFPDSATNPMRRNFEYMPAGLPEEYSAATETYIADVKSAVGAGLQTGGAAAFQDVLRTEILPLIASQYRIDEGRRTLFGQSASGTFCCYTLLTKPDLFTDYVIASPGIPDGEIFRLEQAWADIHDDLPARVMIAAGGLEVADPLSIVSKTSRLAEQLHQRHYPNLRLTSWLIPEANHVQTAARSIARALSESAE